MIAWPLWHLQLSLTKWVGFGRAPLFEFAYCLFAVGSRLIFKYKTHCLQKRKSDRFPLEGGGGGLPCFWELLHSRRPFKGLPAYFSSPVTSAHRSFLQLSYWVPFPSNCLHQKNCPFQVVSKFCFNQVKNKNTYDFKASYCY